MRFDDLSSCLQSQSPIHDIRVALPFENVISKRLTPSTDSNWTRFIEEIVGLTYASKPVFLGKFRSLTPFD
jgi:hypothetical protein